MLDQSTRDNSLRFWENHFEWKSLIDLYPEINGRILDFGCGTGVSDIFLARNGYDITGIDIKKESIEFANQMRDWENEDTKSNLDFCVCNISTEDTNFLGKFDSIWSSHVFEHIKEQEPIFFNLSKVINPGAIILISVPQGYNFNDADHVNHWKDPDDLTKHWEKFTKYIDILKVEYGNLPDKNVLRSMLRFK